MASRRRLARIAVLQTLFELEFPKRNHPDPTQILDQNLAEIGRDSVDIPFACSLLQSIRENEKTLHVIIQEHAPQWPLDRMDRISRALLLLGACELLFLKEAPPAVAMDEAIELAKEFGELESAKFVNGVLNAIAHR
jgi:N utilization substance protein B